MTAADWSALLFSDASTTKRTSRTCSACDGPAKVHRLDVGEPEGRRLAPVQVTFLCTACGVTWVEVTTSDLGREDEDDPEEDQ